MQKRSFLQKKACSLFFKHLRYGGYSLKGEKVNKNSLYGSGMDGKTGIELEPPHVATDRYIVGPLEE